MSVLFSSLNVKTNEDVNKFTFNNVEIEVKQYLPAEQKNEIIEMIVQEADMGSVVNPFAVECLFNVYLVYYYTNIEFTDEEKTNPYVLYDILESSQLLNSVIINMNADEYTTLTDALEEILEKYAVYRNSIKGALEELRMFVPDQTKEIIEGLKDIDTDSIKNVIALADATGIEFKKD